MQCYLVIFIDVLFNAQLHSFILVDSLHILNTYSLHGVANVDTLRHNGAATKNRIIMGSIFSSLRVEWYIMLTWCIQHTLIHFSWYASSSDSALPTELVWYSILSLLVNHADLYIVDAALYSNRASKIVVECLIQSSKHIVFLKGEVFCCTSSNIFSLNQSKNALCLRIFPLLKLSLSLFLLLRFLLLFQS